MRPGLYLKRINCGGPEVLPKDGVPWEADQGKGHANLKSIGTRVWTVPEAVKKTGPYLDVYQTERWAHRHMHYTFKLDPGRYEVLLLFAETNRGFFVKGKRTFDIVLGDDVVAYDSMEALLADDGIQVVVLATPNHLHEPQGLQALAAAQGLQGLQAA